jgi:hypothetical protein
MRYLQWRADQLAKREVVNDHQYQHSRLVPVNQIRENRCCAVCSCCESKWSGAYRSAALHATIALGTYGWLSEIKHGSLVTVIRSLIVSRRRGRNTRYGDDCK